MADLQALDALEAAARRDRRARPTWRRRPRRGSATCSATTRPATSTRSTSSPTPLERAGYLTRDGERLELTPRGSRRIGQKVLDDLFARLRRDAFGGHRLDRARPGRGARGDDEAVRVRRSVPSRSPADAGQRLRREENAPAPRAAGRGG